MPSGVLLLSTLAALALAGTGYAILTATGGSEPMLLTGDGCLRMTAKSEAPASAPDRTLTIDMHRGDEFGVEKWTGIWRVHLQSDGAEFARVSPAPSPDELRWTEAYHIGWCQTAPDEERFIARDDGRVQLRAWAGEGDGFTVD